MATFKVPVVFNVAVLLPTAVLSSAVLADKELFPIAVFLEPVVTASRAALPIDVL